MKRPAVRCRCGHQVLAKEVLRTDLYERPSGREYVYVKYRCKRCKRMGETFVAEHRWDWRIFEAPHNELSESETELFSDQAPISSEELLDFHRHLAAIGTTRELLQSDEKEETAADENHGADAADDFLNTPRIEARPETKLEAKPEIKPEAKKDSKKDTGQTARPDDGNARP